MSRKSSATKNVVAATAPVAEPAPAPVSAVTETVPAETVEEQNAAPVAPAQHPVQLTLDGLAEAIRGLREKLVSAETLLRTLNREAKKLCKRRVNSGNKPSNLTLPLGISDKLASFLGKDSGSQMTRGQVTAAINNYAKSNNIKDPENGRVIIMDAKLAELLGKSTGDRVEIINLQSFLRDHYIKPEAPKVSAV